jgi:hypothetical protein
MSVSGLAITLSEQTKVADAAITALHRHHAVELGPRVGRRLAATTDTASTSSDEELWHWMRALPGVDHIDVVFVHFDEPEGTHQ